MTKQEIVTFFETYAAYYAALNAEAKEGWIRWLDHKDVTLDECLKILESLKEQKDKPRLPQFQARFLQRRNVGAYRYNRGCERCKFQGRSTGWLQGLYGMKAKWAMKYYTGVPIEQRNWFQIWPAVLVDPRDKREEVIHQYYQLHGIPCNCDLGDRMLKREIAAERRPFDQGDDITIATRFTLTQKAAGIAVAEFQALAVKKYGVEATKAQKFGGALSKATGGMFGEADPAKFRFPEKKESEFARELQGSFVEPQPQPEIPPDPAPRGSRHEEQNVRWEDLEIPL